MTSCFMIFLLAFIKHPHKYRIYSPVYQTNSDGSSAPYGETTFVKSQLLLYHPKKCTFVTQYLKELTIRIIPL